jgi:hypothetical protein
MPMIPEDIITALTTISASENMNERQRVVMTEAAALIKHQQLLVMDADEGMKKAEKEVTRIMMFNCELRDQTARALALNDYLREQLGALGLLKAIPDKDEE